MAAADEFAQFGYITTPLHAIARTKFVPTWRWREITINGYVYADPVVEFHSITVYDFESDGAPPATGQTGTVPIVTS